MPAFDASPRYLAVSCTVMSLDTVFVVIVKLVEVEPAGILIVAGATASGPLDVSITVAPPAGAAPFR